MQLLHRPLRRLLETCGLRQAECPVTAQIDGERTLAHPKLLALIRFVDQVLTAICGPEAEILLAISKAETSSVPR